jgi:hypothetical protein
LREAVGVCRRENEGLSQDKTPIRKKAEAAYRRGDLFGKRRKLMDAWAGYCLNAGAEVVALRRKA